MMKKLYCFLLFLILSVFTSACLAKDFEPNKHIVLIYKVPDTVLLCQNSNEDMTKGTIEFEKELKNHYGKRFIVEGIKRLPVLPRLGASDYISMVNINQEPFVLSLEIIGTGVKTVTYQNMFGGTISSNVPTLKMKRSEYIVSREDNAIYGVEYNEVEYHSDTMAIGRQIAYNTDTRKNTKNCIRGYIRDYSTYQGDKINKYADPNAYEDYNDSFAGNFKEIANRQTENYSNKVYLGFLCEELFITRVDDNGALEKAGGKLKDRIISINNIAINTDDELTTVLSKYKPGDTLMIKVLRNGAENTLNVCAEVRTMDMYKNIKI
ncbi:PDZ domain-containing protein [Phascolarctobacterium sp.]|uniref:PDZ domain-containing protein n=1 Tax=Phascolarctobacterium sp. TaxID=2049039 RepID=UPI00386B211E